MSRRARSRGRLPAQAQVFAALGDATRLALLARLAGGEAQSITRLAEGSTLTRQAVTKHLGVLEGAGLVRRKRVGRESLYAMRPEPLRDAFSFLDDVSRAWDDALARLKRFVEA
ncbi:MAG: metalloregulator ArsR/SmtB family transcription factor [Hyphomicrobiales bacterium]